MKKNKKFKRKTKDSRHSKLSLFQKPDAKFFKSCPLSGKNAPVIDYKNINSIKPQPLPIKRWIARLYIEFTKEKRK